MKKLFTMFLCFIALSFSVYAEDAENQCPNDGHLKFRGMGATTSTSDVVFLICEYQNHFEFLAGPENSEAEVIEKAGRSKTFKTKGPYFADDAKIIKNPSMEGFIMYLGNDRMLEAYSVLSNMETEEYGMIDIWKGNDLQYQIRIKPVGLYNGYQFDETLKEKN